MRKKSIMIWTAKTNDIKDVKKCKECGEYFWQTDDERNCFTDRNMKAPCRYSCSKKEENDYER